jgi:ribonucleoside-diphosphate reductase alpha chain
MYEEMYWANSDTRTFMSRGYLAKDQTVEDRIDKLADAAENILKIEGFAKKFRTYLRKGWYSISTPIWSNFGLERGSPISCFSSLISDSIESFLLKSAEVGFMSKIGGGTSGYFGNIRPRGSSISNEQGKAEGPICAMRLFDCVTSVVSQGGARRGSFAAYLPIDHPDIEEFLMIKGEGHIIQEMSIGVCISDEWMKSMLAGDKEKRRIWGKVIEKRFASGYPYIFFSDAVNNNAPQVYKDKGMRILGSNLCSEVTLFTSPEESFVCDLSSMNLLHYDEWKDTDAVETLIYFLDAVMTEFIEKTDGMVLMKAANTFARKQRALGLGTLGWHSLLQSKMIPFESMAAKYLNVEIWKLLKERTLKATKELAVLFGEPELLKGYEIRNVTQMAVAPTVSSSFILGQVSSSNEPFESNYFLANLAKGKFPYKNPFLQKLLAELGYDTEEVWMSILKHDGSVQHLDFLTQEQKDVFKTFGEISQREIVIQACQRQKYIDQSQSLNIKVAKGTKPKDVSDLLIFGWQQGVKTFYYQKNFNAAQELTRSINNCTSCEG